MSGSATVPTDVTVVVPVHSDERWSLICAAVDAVLAQSPPPAEVIVCVDHNPELLERCRARWDAATTPAVHVVASRYEGHVSASRTTATELARSPIVVFLDDDAVPTADWLERMVAPFADAEVVAVGGQPRPTYARPRPRWFPYEFDWIFGCAYRGLPETPAPVLRLIGTTIAARRSDLLAIDGFHFDAFEDMAMCHRLRTHSPGGILLYEPRAVVDHHVHANRLTWAYFWRRCFWVNRGKVAVMQELGTAGDLAADRRFVVQAVRSLLRDAAAGLRRGDVGGVLRLGAACVGFALAATAYGVGLAQWKLRLPARWPTGRRPPREPLAARGTRRREPREAR